MKSMQHRVVLTSRIDDSTEIPRGHVHSRVDSSVELGISRTLRLQIFQERDSSHAIEKNEQRT